MGAHGTLGEALANVESFATADAQNERALMKKQKRSGKDKDEKKFKKSHKKKERREERKSKRTKEAKASKHGKRSKSAKKRSTAARSDASGSADSSSDSDSGSGGGNATPSRGGLEAELARGRHAARCTRELLLAYPDQRKDLRQLLWTVDQGSALDVSGIPDAAMREQLIELLSNLPLERTSKGVFMRRRGSASVLSQLGHVFDEAPAQLRSACSRAAAAAAQEPAAAAVAAATGPAGDPSASGASSLQAGGGTEPALGGDVAAGPSAPPAAAATAAASEPGLNLVREGSVELDYGSEQDAPPGSAAAAGPGPAAAEAAKAEGAGASVRPDIGPDCGPVVAGPHFGLAIGPAAGPSISDAPSGAPDADERQEPAPPAAVPPHVHGPARPPAELLEAAQEAAAAMAAEEAARQAEEEADTFLGPMPLDVVAEAEEAGADRPTAEVMRICKVLAAPERFVTVGKEPPVPDAYEVLGVEPDVDAAAARRQFMKLSLWVHPDKNAHAKAVDAFHAADVAFKTVKDEAARAALDAAREDAALRRAAVAQAEDLERARQWRLARGTATEEDRRGPVRAEPEGRGAWMTQLPASRRPAAPQQVNVTAFSQSGVGLSGAAAAGAREWTETPTQKLARLTAAAAAGPAALPGPGADAAQRPAAATAQALDAFNSGNRRKTLVEQHAERLAAEKKERKLAKKRKAAEAAAGGGGASKTADGKEGWEHTHAWRPFDRERDLGHVPAATNPEEVLKKAGSLTSRFGSGAGSGAGRTFL